MMAAFIDLKKAYDTVDWEKMLDCLEHLGLRVRLGAFLEELYSGVECEVRVSEVLSNPCEVTTGLRQGCVLSPLVFSLNGVVEKLREAKVGVRCGVKQVPALLFADDMVILAEGEEELRRGMGVLEWRSEWAVKVNADKCGVMHIRRNGVKRTTSLFSFAWWRKG